MRTLLLAAGLSGLCGAAAAQEGVPGRWAPWREGGAGTDLPAAQAAAMRANVDAVHTAFQRAVPAFGTPDGWWGMRIRDVGPREDDVWTEGARWPARAGFSTAVIRSWRDDAGRTRWEVTEGRASIGLRGTINSLRCIFPAQHQPIYRDDAGPIYEAPVRTTEVGGFPVYNHDCLVVTRRTAPLWRSAPRERVGRVLLAAARTSLADVDRGLAEARSAGAAEVVTQMTPMRTALARRVADWEAHLAAMTPAERAAPAFLRLSAMAPTESGEPLGNPWATEARENESVELVFPNPAFFDLSRPAEVQLVTVTTDDFGPLGCEHPVCEEADRALFAAIARQMDWSALAALTR